MSNDPRDEVRRLMAKYGTPDPDRVREALDFSRPQPTDAELAGARILAEYGFTADGIREAIAAGESIEILAFRDDEDGDAS